MLILASFSLLGPNSEANFLYFRHEVLHANHLGIVGDRGTFRGEFRGDLVNT